MADQSREEKFKDPVTGNPITAEQQSEAQQRWAREAAVASEGLPVQDPAAAADRLYGWLDRQSRYIYDGAALQAPLCRHAVSSFLPDHALLTSALVFCLGYGRADVHWLRLAALAHELPAEEQQRLLQDRPGAPEWLAAAGSDLVEQGAWLESHNTLAGWQGTSPADEARRLLWLAHLAASNPLQVEGDAAAFQMHPLYGDLHVGIVFGGATKIKDYVFESAKLPDIRGASSLLDRVNLLDVPALWGRHPRWPRQGPVKEDQSTLEESTVPETVEDRYHLVQQTYACLAAPECLIYANGGDLLALAPAALAAQMAAQVERLYAVETLVAGAVAVAGTFTLLELQYGLDCTRFWVGEATAAWTHPAARPHLAASYGLSADQPPDRARLQTRKHFGELVSSLALARYRRREGHPPPAIPCFEMLPHAQRCSSCDRRGAILQMSTPDGDFLCEPCARKRWMGMATKLAEPGAKSFANLNWHPTGAEAWYQRFGDWLKRHPQEKSAYYGDSEASPEKTDNPQDLQEIGAAARPRRFIGVVYGDGNNVGGLIEKIATPGAYHQFAGRLYQATQDAVYTALARHLHPQQRAGGKWYHPFEILSIGGDDLFVIVPGHLALDVAREIGRNLEVAFQDSSGAIQPQQVQRYRPEECREPAPRISLSAGVVIAAEDNPIYFLQDMVEELLKSAKGLAKELKEETRRQKAQDPLQTIFTGSTVDFAVLKAVTMVTSSVRAFRSEALEIRRGPDRLRLTGRPYTLHELAGLQQAVRILKRAAFPRSQLYQLRGRLFKGRLVSTIDYLYLRSRLGEDDQRALQQAFDNAWHDHHFDQVPWRRQDRGKKLAIWQVDPITQQRRAETILADLVEIYDFVSAEEHDGPTAD